MKEIDLSLVAKAKGVTVDELRKRLNKKNEVDDNFDDQTGVKILSANSFSAPRMNQAKQEFRTKLFQPKRKLPGFMFQKSGDDEK